MTLPLVLFAFAARSAELHDPLTLESVLAAVRSENQELLSSRRSAEAASRISEGSWLPDDPMLEVGTMEMPFGMPSLQGMVEYSQMLPNPWKLAARARAASARSVAARAAADMAERRVLAMARRAFSDYSLAAHSLRVNRLDFETAEDVVRAMRARYASGVADQPELLRAQQELLTVESELLDVRLAIESARAELNALLHRDPDAALPPPAGPPPAPDVETMELPPLHALADLHRPELAMARAMLREADALRSQALAEYVPDLSIRASYMPMLRGTGMDMWKASLGIAVPMYGWAKQRGASGAARAAAEAARARAAYERDRARREVTQAFLSARSAARHAKLHRERLIPLAERAVRSALAGYKAGRVAFATLMDAVRQQRRHHVEELEYTAKLQEALARLEEAVGAEIRGAEERR